MVKKVILAVIIILFFYACTASKAPKHKKYVMKETFINIKGLNVPELTPDRKVFNPSKELVADMKNCLPMRQISSVYGDHESAYREAVKHHLLKITYVNVKSYEYQYVTYGKNYLNLNDKCDIIHYAFTEDDILEFISEKKMEIVSLPETVYTGEFDYTMYTNKARIEYETTFSYYPNGNIRRYFTRITKAQLGTKYLNFQSIAIGTEMSFDEDGNLLMSVNHEDDFMMDFPILLMEVMKGRNELFDRNKPYGVKILDIKRNKNRLGCFWIVPYQLGEKRFLYRIIDDESGLVKDEFEYDEQTLKKYTEQDEEYARKIKELRKSFN